MGVAASNEPVPVIQADAVHDAGADQPGRRVLFWFGVIASALAVVCIALGVFRGTEVTTQPGKATKPAAPTPTPTSTKTTNAPSDTVVVALLGIGAALVLAGGLYARLTAIKLPGGVEVDLSPEEKLDVAAKAASAVEAKAASAKPASGAAAKPGSGTDPTAAAAAAVRAVDHARRRKVPGRPLSEAAIDEAVRLSLAES